MKSKARVISLLVAGLVLVFSGSSGAQIALPRSGGVLPGVLGRANDTAAGALRPLSAVAGDVAQLADDRIARLDSFARRHRAIVELDADGQPARAHELLLLDPDAAALQSAVAGGYRLAEQGEIAGLGIGFARFETPGGLSLTKAATRLRRLLPGKTITADQIHFEAGHVGGASPAQPLTTPHGGTVGIIDGGVPQSPRLAGQAGFATGAPRPENHAQAIASLLAGAGVEHIYVADVYGTDPAGGSALAIARAVGWMALHGVGVVSISLVGPANPLLARAVAGATAKGMIVVAAVGNDGAAAPPAYPASYQNVAAVTGVDGRGRVLFEAGHALHVEYAAPGADLTAIGLDGKPVALRGTSFAAPLAAARITAHRLMGQARANALAATNTEATGASARTGHGTLCNTCRHGL